MKAAFVCVCVLLIGLVYSDQNKIQDAGAIFGEQIMRGPIEWHIDSWKEEGKKE